MYIKEGMTAQIILPTNEGGSQCVNLEIYVSPEEMDTIATPGSAA